MPGYYRFAFGNSVNSDLTVTYSTDGVNFIPYSEPAWPPNPSNPGSVLQVNTNDVVYVQLVGPNNWSLNGVLQLVVARANSAASGQAYSPFTGFVWMNPPGSITNNIWQAQVGTVTLNPGKGVVNKFELTVAFNASLPGVTGPAYFSEDPEMDVTGI